MERRDDKDEAEGERGKGGGGGCVRVRGEGVLLCTETILKDKGGDGGRSIQDSEEKEKDGVSAVWRGVGIVVEDGGSVRMQGGSICSIDYKVRPAYKSPAYKSHKHLRAQTGQEGPRPRVDSPVSEPIHHRLVISLR